MLTYAMDERGDETLYEYLYRCIRRDIETGAIAAHQRLPSKRALAKNLGVSLITVEGAYTQLVAEGYVYALPRRGYYACALGCDGAGAPLAGGGVRRREAGATGEARRSLPAAAPSPDPALASEPAPAPLVADLTGRSTPQGLFPYASWAKTTREVLTCESERTLLEQSVGAGSPRLRQALATYLRSSRGMAVDPAQIVVGAGAQTLYNLIVQLLGRGRGYAVEDPGYPRLTQIYRVNDVPLSHVALDAEGVRVDELRACGADVVHIMPSHQFPTGQVTSIGRRYELLGWASERAGRVIVEDDYDCEFRLSGRPIPALQSIDACGCVVYANTFAKSLGPAFRIGYMVLPAHLAATFEERLGFYSCTVSTIEQLALARFMEGGGYERHVSRARTYYRAVRNDLVDALRACAVADRLVVEATDAGLHFLMGVRGVPSEAALVEAARRRGVALTPLSGFYQRREDARAWHARARAWRAGEGGSEGEGGDGSGDVCWFVVGYSSLAREAAGPAVEALACAVRATG